MSAPQNGSSQQQQHPHLPHQNTVCAMPSPSWQEESPGNEQKGCVDAEAWDAGIGTAEMEVGRTTGANRGAGVFLLSLRSQELVSLF